jgi:hypothetical protein
VRLVFKDDTVIDHVVCYADCIPFALDLLTSSIQVCGRHRQLPFFISIVTVNTIIIIIIIIGNTICRSVQLPSYRLEDQRIKSHLFVVFVSYRHQI